MTAEPPAGLHIATARGLPVAHVAGEFCLLTEALNFGQKPFLPLKHRIRDAASLEDKLQFASPVTASVRKVPSPASLQEQLLFVETGAKLHCNYWADNEAGHLTIRRHSSNVCTGMT